MGPSQHSCHEKPRVVERRESPLITPPAMKSSDTCSGAEAPPTFALSAATISQPAPDPAGVLLRLPGWPPAPAEQ